MFRASDLDSARHPEASLSNETQSSLRFPRERGSRRDLSPRISLISGCNYCFRIERFAANAPCGEEEAKATKRQTVSDNNRPIGRSRWGNSR